MQFGEQVEALTGIAIDGSSDPTQTELSAFLQDGVKDVVNRMIEARPAELSKFTATTNSTRSITKTGKIMSVVREHDSVTILRSCTVISPGDRYDATDTDSLNYRSKTNPGYYELDGSVHTVPAAAQSGDNEVHVTQVSYDAGVVFGDTVGSGIDNFPTEYEHLVGIYAAIQSLHNNMADTTISALSINTVPPDIPSTPSFTYTNAADDTSIDSTIGAITTLSGIASAPTYTPPAIDASGGELVDLRAGSDKIDFNDWFDQVGDYIETDEDVELAGAQLQKINSYIGAYNTAMTNQLHEFNEANAAYQAEVKELLQESANEVTRLTTIYNKASDINLQNALRTYQRQVDEYMQKISRYSAEVTGYSADVAREVQEYTNNLQRQTTNYQWKQGQMLTLQAQYERAFIPPGAGGGE